MNETPPQFAHPSFEGWIGVGREDITPPIGIYARNWGAAHHDVAEGIHRPLSVTALTIQDSEDSPPLVLVAMDLGWWRRVEDEWIVRGGLIAALSLDPSRVMLHCTHTHSGPSICLEDADKPGGHLIAPYLDHVRDAVIAAVRAALETRQKAVLAWEYGKCTLAANRDLPDPDRPRIVNGFNPSLPADDTLLVGRVTGDDGKVVATLVNYACHPITLSWQNRLISPDYVGAMRELIESETQDAPCLFLLGAAGEFGSREQYTDDVSIADANGRKLGYAVLSTLAGMLPPRTALEYSGVMESGAPLALWTRSPFEPSTKLDAKQIDVEYELKSDLPTVAEIETILGETTDRAKAERLARLRRVRMTVGDGQTAQIPLWVWRVGDAVLVGQMNEAYSDFQRELRKAYPENAVVVMNMVNGACGYLPPRPLYEQDIYQVWQTPFASGGMTRLISRAVNTVNKIMFPVERIEGADLLLNLFGYWPTFHDASVEKVTIDREGPTVTVDFILNDMNLQEETIMVNSSLRWHEVFDLSFEGIDWHENNWIQHLEISLKQGILQTEIERMDGFSGTIRSRSLEILNADLIQRESTEKAEA